MAEEVEGDSYFGSQERPLAVMETVMARSHDHDGSLIDTNVIIIGGKKLSAEVSMEALKELQRREVILRTKIVKQENESSFYFAQMEQPFIDFQVYPSKKYDKWWIDELQYEIENKFSLEGPLWRVRYYEADDTPTVILFSFHHSAFDGGAIMAFYDKFLSICAEIDSGVSQGSVCPSGLFRPPSDIFKQKSSWLGGITFILKALWFYFRKKYTTVYNPQAWNSPAYHNPETPAHTRIYPLTLEESHLNELKQKCKEHNVTIHSVVTAAALVSYLKCYNVDCSKANRLVTGHSVSLRRFCTPVVPRNILGNYLCPFFTTSKINTVESVDIWDVALEIQNQLHGKRFKGTLAFFFKLFQTLFSKNDKPPVEPSSETLGRNTTMPFNISNRGYFPEFNKSFGDYKLLETYWSTAEHKRGFTHTHNIVSFGGKLFWSLSYYTHVTTLQQTQKYAEELLNTLENA